MLQPQAPLSELEQAQERLRISPFHLLSSENKTKNLDYNQDQIDKMTALFDKIASR